MATAEHAMWVTKRYPALGNLTGFVKVPADMRAALIADNGAQDTFDYRSAINPAPAITALTFTPAAVTTASPVGTVAGTLAASGGTSPFTYALINTDGGNFQIDGASVKTAVTPLTEGAHNIVARAIDAAGRQKLVAGTVTVTAPAAPQARTTMLRKSK